MRTMKKEMDKFERIEYQQIHQTFRVSVQTLVSVFSFFGLANITLVGYIATQQKAGFFLLGALIWLAALIAFSEYRRYMVPFCYRAVALEEKYARGKEGIISLFLRIFYSGDFVEKLRQATKIKSSLRKREFLFGICPDTAGQTSLIIWMLMAVIGQILVVPVFIYFWHWGLF